MKPKLNQRVTAYGLPGVFTVTKVDEASQKAELVCGSIVEENIPFDVIFPTEDFSQTDARIVREATER